MKHYRTSPIMDIGRGYRDKPKTKTKKTERYAKFKPRRVVKKHTQKLLKLIKKIDHPFALE